MAEVHGNRTCAQNTEETGVTCESGAESGALGAQTAPIEADLARLIEAWPTLPDAVTRRIMALLDDAAGE